MGTLHHPHCVRPSFWSITRPHSVAASRYSRRPLQSARTSEFLPSLIHGVGRQRGKDRRKGNTRATRDLVERKQATWQTRHVFPDYRGVRRYGPDGTTRAIVCRDLYGCQIRSRAPVTRTTLLLPPSFAADDVIIRVCLLTE